jgi:quercetin dioxygenase-like cupin family protein
MGRLGLPCCLALLTACAGNPRLIVPNPQGAQQASLATLLEAHPLPGDENIKAVPVGRTDSLSFHLVQIRDRERPHIHDMHDLVVTLLRGKGTLYVEGVAHDMRAGDVAAVPRGTPHYFVNTDCRPAATFVTFAPPYDGTDQVPVQ